MANIWINSGNSARFYFGGLQNHCRWWLQVWNEKTPAPRKRSYDQLQFSSVAQSCPTLCDHVNCSTPGFPVHHQLPESTQTHVHWVGDAIQPSHPLLSPSSSNESFQMCQLFVSGGQSIGVSSSISVLSMNTQDCFFSIKTEKESM